MPAAAPESLDTAWTILSNIVVADAGTGKMPPDYQYREAIP